MTMKILIAFFFVAGFTLFVLCGQAMGLIPLTASFLLNLLERD